MSPAETKIAAPFGKLRLGATAGRFFVVRLNKRLRAAAHASPHGRQSSSGSFAVTEPAP